MSVVYTQRSSLMLYFELSSHLSLRLAQRERDPDFYWGKLILSWVFTLFVSVLHFKKRPDTECFWKFSCLLYLIHVLNLCFKSCLSLHLYIFFSLSLCLFPLMSEYFCPGLGSKGSRNSWPSLAQPAQHQTKCLWQLNAQLLTVIHHHRAWTNHIEGRVHQRALL